MKLPAPSSSHSAVALLLAVLLLLVGPAVGLRERTVLGADQAFWVVHSDGVSLLGPEIGEYSGELRVRLSRASDDDAEDLRPQNKESLCAGEDCVWGEAVYLQNSQLAAISDTKASRVLVYEMLEVGLGRLMVNIPTCHAPVQLLAAPWRNSIFVSCRGGVVDRLSTKNWDIAFPKANVLLAQTEDSHSVYGRLVASEEMPDLAFSSNAVDPGYHKIILSSMESEFINLTPHGCMRASDIILSTWNLHGFIKCEGDSNFILEINLKSDEVVQKVDVPGAVFPEPGTNQTLIVNEQENITHIFEAGESGQPTELDGRQVEGIEGFSQLAFVLGTAEFGFWNGIKFNINVAVLTSRSHFKVLLVNLNEANDTKLIEYSPLHNATNLADGQARNVAAALYDGRLAFAVAAPELNSTFLINTFWDENKPFSSLSLWDTVLVAQVEGIRGSAQSVMYLPEVDESAVRPLSPAVTRQSASSLALERVEGRLEELQENLWGTDLSDSFWAFTPDGLRAIDPADGSTLARMDNSSMCSGTCSWGYPVTDGQNFVVVPKRTEDRIMAFDIHTGRVLAEVETCKSPYRVGMAPWRHEIFVHCWSRPEDDSVHNSDGLVDVIGTSDWAVQNPLIDVIFSPQPPIHGKIFTSPAFPKHAWSTNFADHGLHKLDLETRQSTFIDLSEHGCNNASSLVISARNGHGFLQCNHGSLILELDLGSDEVVTALDVTGTPFATEDGVYIVVVPEQVTADKLHIFQARQQGTASKLVAEISEGIRGLDQVAFAERDGAHVAVVTSKSESKVLIIDMNDFDNTRVLAFRDGVSGSPSEPLDGHPSRHAVAAGVMEDGRMVALVSVAQREDKLHVIDMGTGVLPPLEVASVVHSVEGVEGMLPKLLYVPKAQRKLRHGPVQGEVASVGLLERVREEGEQVQQQVVRLEDYLASAAQIASSADSQVAAAAGEQEGVEQSLSVLLTGLNVSIDEGKQVQQQVLRLEDFVTSAAGIASGASSQVAAAAAGEEGVEQSLSVLLTGLNVSLDEGKHVQQQVVRIEDFFTSAAEIVSSADSQDAAAATAAGEQEGVEQSLSALLTGLNASLAAQSEASAERQQMAQRMTTVEEYVAELSAAVTDASHVIKEVTSNNTDTGPPSDAAAAAGKQRSLVQASSADLDLGRLQALKQSVQALLSDLRTNTEEQQEAKEVQQDVTQRLDSTESQLREAMQRLDSQAAQLKAMKGEDIDSSASDVAIAAIVISCVGFVGMLALAAVSVAGAVRAEQAHRRLKHSSSYQPSESDRASGSNPGSHDELINPLSHVRGGGGDNRV